MKKNKILILLIIIFIFSSVLIFYVINDSNTSLNLKGTWVADGTQYQFAIGYENGEIIYADISTPFYLELDGKGNYTLNMGEYTEIGTYSFFEENLSLRNNDGLITERCEIKEDTNLYCEFYASLYIKK